MIAINWEGINLPMQWEHKYSSGDAIVQFSLVRVWKTRACLNFIVSSADGKIILEIVDSTYLCPSHWDAQKIASDIFSWTLHFDESLYDHLVFDDSIKNEDVVLVVCEN